MSAWSQQPEENNNVNIHVWPWEDEFISAADIRRSLQSLSSFIATVPIAQLQTIEDVSAVASLVGHDLCVIAKARGRKIEPKMKYPVLVASELVENVEEEYVFTMRTEDREITITAIQGHAYIAEKKIIGFQQYQREMLRVKVPSDRDIAIGDRPVVGVESIYALDLRNQLIKEYHPVREPYNPEVQQGFVRVLQDALKNVLRIR